MLYPCLKDYIKESNNSALDALFLKIQNASDTLFSGYDADDIREVSENFYYDNYKKPLKTIYKHRFDALDTSDAVAVRAFFEAIGKASYKRFGDNWERVYKTYFLSEYNPLDNYSIDQVRTPDLTTESTTTRKQDTKVTTSGESGVVPFNSIETQKTGVSSGESETVESDDKNEIQSTVGESGTDTLRRHGNIGVTSSQELIGKELELRRLDFLKMLFRDIESIIFRDYWPA